MNYKYQYCKRGHNLSEERTIHGNCRLCVKERFDNWYVKNGIKRSLEKYGITQEQYDSLYMSQRGRCAICHTDDFGRNARPSIDHDHITGAVRGILCSNCNTAIGLFRDSVDVLESAINYLKDE